jgi:hypothetical protein
MEVGRLVDNPRKEPCKLGLAPQIPDVSPKTLQFRVGEMRVQRTVAYRMDRHRFPATPALGHRMVPFDLSAKRPCA